MEVATVRIADGCICDLVDEPLAVCEGEQAWDVGGRTVMPGLIDAHVHLSMPDPDDLWPEDDWLAQGLRPYLHARAAKAILAAGVTTVRDVGGYGDEVLALRAAVRSGTCPGPRIFTCGQIIAPSCRGARRFDGMYVEADGADAGRRAVRDQAARGANFIKVMVTGALTVDGEDVRPALFTRPELDAIIDEAHRLDLPVAAHAEGLDGIRLSLEAGVDTLEHGEQLYRAPGLLDLMVDKGIILVPTLSVFEDVASGCAYSPTLAEQAERLRHDARQTLSAARAAGVTIAMGYDCNPHGTNAREIVRLVEAGLSPSEALVAATSSAARACFASGIGHLAPGAVADLIVVDGDPLADPSILTDPARISLVMHGGEPISDPGISLGLGQPRASACSEVNA
jgi:imidazolonepropionase-like amidohydrolase